MLWTQELHNSMESDSLGRDPVPLQARSVIERRNNGLHKTNLIVIRTHRNEEKEVSKSYRKTPFGWGPDKDSPWWSKFQQLEWKWPWHYSKDDFHSGWRNVNHWRQDLFTFHQGINVILHSLDLGNQGCIFLLIKLWNTPFPKSLESLRFPIRIHLEAKKGAKIDQSYDLN